MTDTVSSNFSCGYKSWQNATEPIVVLHRSGLTSNRLLSCYFLKVTLLLATSHRPHFRLSHNTVNWLELNLWTNIVGSLRYENVFSLFRWMIRHHSLRLIVRFFIISKGNFWLFSLCERPSIFDQSWIWMQSKHFSLESMYRSEKESGFVYLYFYVNLI